MYGDTRMEMKTKMPETQQLRLEQSDSFRMRNASLRNDNSKSELDRRLEQALLETFPASDSIAVIIC
jgi:hypothetical protein